MLKKLLFVFTSIIFVSFYANAQDVKEEITLKGGKENPLPYSKAIKYDDLIFVSGQIGLNSQGQLQEGIEAQTKQALDNLIKILEAAKSDMSKVVKVNIYVTDINDFEVVNKIYATYFSKPYPARTFIQVAKIPKNALIEIDATAHK
jgi:2-iminobutanoate/2-iminopropanoate deaminase